MTPEQQPYPPVPERGPVSDVIRALSALSLGFLLAYGADKALDHFGIFSSNTFHQALAPNAIAYVPPDNIPRTVVPEASMLGNYLTPVPGELEPHLTNEAINWINEFQNRPDISDEFRLYLGRMHQAIAHLFEEGKFKVVVDENRQVPSASLYFISHLTPSEYEPNQAEEVLVYKMMLPESPESNPSSAAHEMCHALFRFSAHTGNPAVYDAAGQPLKFDELNLHNYVEEEYVCIATDTLTSYFYEQTAAQEDDEQFQRLGVKIIEIAAILDANRMLLTIDSDSFFSVGNLFGALTDYIFTRLYQGIYKLDGLLEDEKKQSLEGMLYFGGRLESRRLSPEEQLYLEYFLQNGLISGEAYQTICELTASD